MTPYAARIVQRLRRARLAAVVGAIDAHGPRVLVVALALVAVAPALAAPGIVATRAGGDSPFLLQRVFEMAVALRGGHFPARWMPDAAHGLGYPFWNFYAPLAYGVAGTVAVLGGGVIGAVKLTQALCFVLAALGAYRLARSAWGTAAAGVVAAAAYTFAPYHLLNVYVRGDALAELAAYAVAPWLLVAIDGALLRPSARSVARLAFVTALLPLAHNISALLLAPLVAAFTVWRWWGRRALRGREAVDPVGAGQPEPVDLVTPSVRARRAVPWFGNARRGDVRVMGDPRDVPDDVVGERRAWHAVPLRGWVVWADGLLAGVELRGWRIVRAVASPAGAVVGAGALGAGAAAWFWVPAVFEQHAVQLAGNTSGYFSYRNHFLALVDLSAWLGERGDVGGVRGLLRSLVTGPAVFDPHPWVRYDAAAGVPATTGIVLLALAILGAAAVWRRSARRGAVRFWVGAALAATLLTTAVSWPLWEMLEPLAWAQFPWRWLNVQALALAMLAGGLGALPAPRARWRFAAALAASVALAAGGMAALDPEVLPIGQPTVADLRTFELFSGNIGSTVRAEYLPWAVNPQPASSVHSVAGVRVGPRAMDGEEVGAALVHDGVASQTWQLDVAGADEATIALPLMWFPGWLATIDGDPPRETRALDGSGWLTVDVPPGRHVVNVSLQRTPIRAWSEVISLAALMLMLTLWLSSAGRLRLGQRATAWAIAVGAAVLIARALPVGGKYGPVTLDWARMPYPHHNPGGLPFGRSRLEAARFEGNDDPGVPIDAGSTLAVSLEWSTPATSDTLTLALVSPAEAQLGVAEDWSTTREPLTGTVAAGLPLPAELPAGVWFVRLTVADADGRNVRAVNASGHPLDAVYLGPVHVRAALRTPAALPAGPVIEADAVALDEVRWTQAADAFTVRLTWRAKRALTTDMKTSVRLMRRGKPVLGADGLSSIQDDKIPGYGFNPPTAWPAGQPVEDRRWLRLPPGLPASDDYAIQVVLYDAWTQAELGSGTAEGVVIAAVPSAPPPTPDPADEPTDEPTDVPANEPANEPTDESTD